MPLLFSLEGIEMTTDKAMVTDAMALIDQFEKAFLDRLLVDTRLRKEAYDNARAALDAALSSLTLERGEAEPVAVNVTQAAEAYVFDKGFEHSGGVIETAFEAGAFWALRLKNEEAA